MNELIQNLLKDLKDLEKEIKADNEMSFERILKMYKELCIIEKSTQRMEDVLKDKAINKAIDGS